MSEDDDKIDFTFADLCILIGIASVIGIVCLTAYLIYKDANRNDRENIDQKGATVWQKN